MAKRIVISTGPFTTVKMDVDGERHTATPVDLVYVGTLFKRGYVVEEQTEEDGRIRVVLVKP